MKTTWICTECWQRAAKCKGVKTELLEIPSVVMEKIEALKNPSPELQKKFDEEMGFIKKVLDPKVSLNKAVNMVRKNSNRR